MIFRPIAMPTTALKASAAPFVWEGGGDLYAGYGWGMAAAAPMQIAASLPFTNHCQQPADHTGMTVILDGSDEFRVTEGYYPTGLLVPGPVRGLRPFAPH